MRKLTDRMSLEAIKRRLETARNTDEVAAELATSGAVLRRFLLRECPEWWRECRKAWKRANHADRVRRCATRKKARLTSEALDRGEIAWESLSARRQAIVADWRAGRL